MTIKEALDILNISDKFDAIYNSHSHGEMHYLDDYIDLSILLKDKPGMIALFKAFFSILESDAFSTWQRPESVYQHIAKKFHLFVFDEYQRQRRV